MKIILSEALASTFLTDVLEDGGRAQDFVELHDQVQVALKILSQRPR